MAYIRNGIVKLNIKGKDNSHADVFDLGIPNGKLEKYGEEVIIEYAEMLEDLMARPVCAPGSRNFDGVNISCLLKFFGKDRPWEYVSAVDDVCFIFDNVTDMNEAKEVFDRVEPYLNEWDDGTTQIISDYMIV